MFISSETWKRLTMIGSSEKLFTFSSEWHRFKTGNLPRKSTKGFKLVGE